MALIEIPNVYNSDTAVSTAGRGRSAVIGEPIVAVDLIDTVAPPGSPVADDLLSADRGAEARCRIERAHVPGGDLPDIRASRRLRSALRAMIEALVDDRPVPKAAAPVRQPGLFDDFHRGQRPAVMVRARPVRQPGTRRPASPPRARGVIEVQPG